MIHVAIPLTGAFEIWRNAMRSLLASEISPDDVIWKHDQPTDSLFVSGFLPNSERCHIFASRAFLELAEAVICHRDAARFAFLHRALLALQKNRNLLEDAADPLVARLRGMEKSVRRDSHKMKAFVRFKEFDAGNEARRTFFAWFEPEHFIIERTAPFFARRFGDMDWTIATPKLTVHHKRGRVSFAAGMPKPQDLKDGADDLWRIYYASIFNPARLKMKAMMKEMPKKYWNNLPEAALIPELIATAQSRANEMIMAQPTQESLRARKIRDNRDPLLPLEPMEGDIPASIPATKNEAARCTRCHLYQHATQTVFGEGPENAEIMFVGEQPGDKEDLQGRPFVGPAGQLFDQILRDVGIDRQRVYITNAVKHFKFEPRGKFRLHKKPDSGEIQACKWWIGVERALIKPKLVVAMGATAAQSLTGNGQGILKRRGNFEALDDGTPVLITIHPSALLRIPEPGVAAAAHTQFEEDLRLVAQRLSEPSLS
jgi:uracil-DNA glycosylase